MPSHGNVGRRSFATAHAKQSHRIHFEWWLPFIRFIAARRLRGFKYIQRSSVLETLALSFPGGGLRGGGMIVTSKPSVCLRYFIEDLAFPMCGSTRPIMAVAMVVARVTFRSVRPASNLPA